MHCVVGVLICVTKYHFGDNFENLHWLSLPHTHSGRADLDRCHLCIRDDLPFLFDISPFRIWFISYPPFCALCYLSNQKFRSYNSDSSKPYCQARILVEKRNQLENMSCSR